jgi:phage regulator Rha-like protein
LFATFINNWSIIKNMKKWLPPDEYQRLCESRYQPWDKHRILCTKAHNQASGVCVCCMKAKSEQVHHTNYSLYGSGDQVGVNVFPVCENCHRNECHSDANWITDSDDPTFGNRNTESFIKFLRRNMNLVTKPGQPGQNVRIFTNPISGKKHEVLFDENGWVNGKALTKCIETDKKSICYFLRLKYIVINGIKYRLASLLNDIYEEVKQSEGIDATIDSGETKLSPVWMHPKVARVYLTYLGSPELTQWYNQAPWDSAKEDNHSLPTRKLSASVTSESDTELTVAHNNTESIDVSDDISYHDGAVVIDSRLLAKRLGLQHKSLLDNIDNNPEYYQTQWGIKYCYERIPNVVGEHYERVCWLNKEQVRAITVRCQLTPQVRDYSILLIKRLSELEAKLSSGLSPQAEELKLAIQLEKAKQETIKYEIQRTQVNEAIWNMHPDKVASMLITGQNPVVVTKEIEVTRIVEQGNRHEVRALTLEQLKKQLPYEIANRFKKWEDVEKFMEDQGIDITKCFVEVKDVRKTKALRRDGLDTLLEALSNVPTTGFIPLPPGSNVVPIKKVI